jgi:NADH-quinone oxidoreductase subunit J
MFLVFNFFILACIYLSLGAQFVAVIQILVYAGAIMILFVFVIMLLNLDDKIEYKTINKKETFRIFLLGMTIILVMYLLSFQDIFINVVVNPSAHPDIGTVEDMSSQLFTRYLLPFEVTSILLLSAIIGAVVLAKKRFP